MHGQTDNKGCGHGKIKAHLLGGGDFTFERRRHRKCNSASCYSEDIPLMQVEP